MSETLNPPWIAGYLINIAETYGCQLSNAPVHLKPGKKVQLIQVSREHWSYVLWFRSYIDCVSSSLSMIMIASGPMSLTRTRR